MGKEWYRAGKSSKRGGGPQTQTQTQTAETPPGCMCAVFQLFDFHPFHHFPINQQHASFKSPSTCNIPEEHGVPKGAEAPRNSLESENGNGIVLSVSKEEDFKIPKNIQIKTSRGTTTRVGNLNNDLSSELCSSPGTKTPTLVARLMGLDLLPGAQSASFSSSSSLSTPNLQSNNPHLHRLRPSKYLQSKPRNSIDSSDIATTRSLPETLRMSSARRSESDVEYHNRLSLQINKENINLGLREELELPRLSFSKRKYDENSCRSPSHYARQIVKQVKDSVSRKVGHDITNTLKNRSEQGRDSRDEFVGQSRVKKFPKTAVKVVNESSPGKHSNPSHSPQLSVMETKQKPTTTTPSLLNLKDQNTHPILNIPSPPSKVSIQPQISRVLTKSKPQALPDQQDLQNQKSVPKCKKATNEKFSSRLKKNKQEESFITIPPSPSKANDIKTTRSKKTHPLSSNLLNNINTVPNFLSLKKTDPSPPATKIPQKHSQVSDTQTQESSSKSSSQLSSCSRQTYKQEGTSTLASRGSNDEEDKSNGASTTGADNNGPEFQYVTGILHRTTGLYTETVSFFNQCRWFFSPTQPLDPSIFHHLEEQLHQYPTSISSVTSPNNNQDLIFTSKNQMGLRCNRKLLFDLVDEVLLEILRSPFRKYSVNGLTEKVWKRIERFPCANCELLEDIDGLIGTEDMKKMKVEGAEAVEEEREGLVAEIEGNIWDTLLHETVMVLACCASRKAGGVRT